MLPEMHLPETGCAWKPGRTNGTVGEGGLLRLLTLVLLCSLTLAFTTAFAAADEPTDPAVTEELDSEFLDDDLDFLEEEEDDTAVTQIWDPLEPWNRGVFQFNNDMYFILIRPMTEVYKLAMPREIRVSIKNFFFNLGSPMRLANCLLQGRLGAFKQEFGRFFLNTTVGLGGIGNPAEHFPSLNPDEEDLGQTLGYWGLGNGFYLVWPMLGPSTLRDSSGFVGDWLYNRYVYNLSRPQALGIYTGKVLNDVSFRLGDYETVLEAAIDPYRAVRDGYIQYRTLKLKR